MVSDPAAQHNAANEHYDIVERNKASQEMAWQDAVFALYLSEGKIEPEPKHLADSCFDEEPRCGYSAVCKVRVAIAARLRRPPLTLHDHRTPCFTLTAPQPLHELQAGNAWVYVYPNAEQMGLASAINIASHQISQIEEKGNCSIMVMAAPSAFGFYRAYQNLVFSSPTLQKALYATDIFQFDDYALPVHHPVSFRFLLMENFLAPIARFCDSRKIHLFQGDLPDAEKACREYGEAILEAGPDLQIKGVGEDGHWGFHEPGIPLDGEPKFMRVNLSESNVAQQMRDHPNLFPDRELVPRYAYTANVPLFMRTRVLIEDNVPQPSKAFAVLAAYGNEVVKDTIPSSALKSHDNPVVRLTSASAWALLEYRENGAVSGDMLRRLDASLSGSEEREIGQSVDLIRETLMGMGIEVGGGS